MKNVSLIVLICIGLAFGAAVIAACDRTADEVNPDPISDGAFGPGTAWSNLMGTGGSIEPPDEEGGADTFGGEDDTFIGDVVEDGAVPEVNQCTGSAIYCGCLESKGNDLKYDGYCRCLDAPTVPGGDHEVYCGCCTFGQDPTFPEYIDEAWNIIFDTTCNDGEWGSPCDSD